MSSLSVLVLNSGSSSIKFSIYEADTSGAAGNGTRRKLLEGAVDGIGTDLGQFWMKDADGQMLFNRAPALPDRSVAFKLVSDALQSGTSSSHLRARSAAFPSGSRCSGCALPGKT